MFSPKQYTEKAPHMLYYNALRVKIEYSLNFYSEGCPSFRTTNKQCNKHSQKLCIVIGSLKSLTDTHLLFVHMSRRRHVTQSLSLQIDSVSSPYKKLNLLTSSIIHRIALGFLFIFYFFTARYSCSPGIINWVFP